jgi:hypothetical protein
MFPPFLSRRLDLDLPRILIPATIKGFAIRVPQPLASS